MKNQKNLKITFKALGLIMAFGCLTSQAIAQEILTPFKGSSEKAPVRRGVAEARFLPFFDDFSHSNVYPDSTKWTDNNVLVNDGFPLCPPNRNGATFDVLDADGRVYNYAISNAFVAEYLTSVRIRLDSIMEPEPRALTPADSVYLSFYYQPQGNGNSPETQDSLVLQFGTTTEHQEFLFLDYQNYSIADIRAGRGFATKFGAIQIAGLAIGVDGHGVQHIRDVKYFRNDFYFRFYNYASIVNGSLPANRSNEDNWNIDFVYLNINRTMDDTDYPMLTFSGQRPSFFNRYQSIPYRQYRINPNSSIRENLEIDIANLDGIDHEVNYYYKVKQIGGGQYYMRVLDPVTIHPYREAGYLNCPEFGGESPACPYVGDPTKSAIMFTIPRPILLWPTP